MTYNNIKQLSFSLSLLIHLLIMVLFLLVKFTIDYPVKEYVELSFGKSGEMGSSGAQGVEIEKIEELAKPEEENLTPEKNEVVKEVELPKAKNTSDENVIKPADKSKEKSTVSSTETKETAESKVTSEGQGNKSEGEGNLGFQLDFGGQGTRKIYNFPLPDYPEGVEKEINIRLRFTIRPDGTVGTIMPLTKADTRLENAAINSLRQWRFEPLSENQRQSEQTAVVVFPYRLQ